MERNHRNIDKVDKVGWTYSDTNGFSADSAAPGHDHLYDEEYAAEIADLDITNAPRRVIHAKPDIQFDQDDKEYRSVVHAGTRKRSTAGMWGAVAILAALASWIVWPTVLAPVAVVAGIIAYTKGRKALGGWSIALGLISLIFFLVSAY